LGALVLQRLVTFDQEQRFFGNVATGVAGRKPLSSFRFLRDLLGKPFGCKEQLRLTASGFPYAFRATDRGSIAVEVPEKGVFSVEELVAMLLEYTRKLGEKAALESVGPALAAGAFAKDAVIAIPEFWSVQQRQALVDAAGIAGVNVLALVGSNSASALQYGIDRPLALNESATICFYDVGSSSTVASIVKYSAFEEIKLRQNKTISQYEVLGIGYSNVLAGRAFDEILLKLFAQQFAEQTKNKHSAQSILENGKVASRLRAMAQKAKEVLSANSETPVFVESLIHDIDFKSHITRDQFYELASSLFEEVPKPIHQALAQANIQLSDLNSILLVGGGTRIPKIQELLKQASGKNELNQNLNADEAPAFGSALKAANLSTQFRVRPYGATDLFPFPIGIRIDGKGTESFSKRASLFPKNSPFSYPSKRKTIQFEYGGDVEISASYDSVSDALPLPEDTDPVFARFQVTKVDEKLKNLLEKEKGKLTRGPKVSVSFQLNTHGILDLVAARGEVTLEIERFKPIVKSENKTVTLNATAEANDETAEESEKSSDDAESLEEDSREEPVSSTDSKPEPIREKEIVNITKSFLLSIEKLPPLAGVKFLNKKEISKSQEVLETYNEIDRKTMERGKALNTLEGFIYSARDKLNNDNDISVVSTPEQRSKLLASLEEAENWIYDNDEPESVEKYQTKLSSLRAVYDPIAFRASELTKRPESIEALESIAGVINKQLSSALDWLPDSDKEGIRKECTEALDWIKHKDQEQSKLAFHEELVFTSDDVYFKVKSLKRSLEILLRKPKPKPKPVEVNVTDSSNSTDSEKPSDEDKKPDKDEL